MGLLLGHAGRDGGAWVLHRRRRLDTSHGDGSGVEYASRISVVDCDVNVCAYLGADSRGRRVVEPGRDVGRERKCTDKRRAWRVSKNGGNQSTAAMHRKADVEEVVDGDPGVGAGRAVASLG
jgi:hypothetical protein